MPATKAAYSLKDRQRAMEVICMRVTNGESLAVICRDKHMPCVSSVGAWFNLEEGGAELLAEYERAREMRADKQADEIIEIANSAALGYIDVKDDDGVVQRIRLEPSDAIAQAKTQIDARKWHAARMAPKTWGDKQQVDHEHHVVGKIVVDFRE